MLWNPRVIGGRLAPLLLALLALLTLPPATAALADGFDTAQSLRLHDCATSVGGATTLQRSAVLAAAAALLARGLAPGAAAERSGYRAERVATLHVSGPPSALRQTLRDSACQTLSDPALRDAGVYQRGPDTWLVLATPYELPTAKQAPALAKRITQLVNEARARGRRCGARWFAPTPPVHPSALLDGVARSHAADMAVHRYFDHRDRAGRTPADRVREAGYLEQVVGENIAYGPLTAEEVVQGWLHSPGHCENLMDPRFIDMGVAFAPGRADRPALYWAQELAAPRESSKRAATRRPQA